MADSTVNDQTPDDLEQIFNAVMTCEPALARTARDTVADLVFDKGRTVRPWRLTAALACEGGEFFRRLADTESMAKEFAPTVDVLRDFAKTLRELADLADCVSARVMVAGCNHDDFNKWTTEAQG